MRINKIVLSIFFVLMVLITCGCGSRKIVNNDVNTVNEKEDIYLDLYREYVYDDLFNSKDGLCTFNGVACTYKVGTHDFAQDLSSQRSIKPCLIIEADYTYYYHPIDVGTLSDGDISQFVYSGN